MISTHSVRTPASWIVFFATIYIAVLPMSETIALRNVSLLLLLLAVTWHCWKTRTYPIWPLPVIIWAVYLLVFPLISTDAGTAWRSLGTQWGMGLLAMLAGAGAAAALAPYRWSKSIWLGAASCVTIIVHLVMFANQSLQTGIIPWGYWGRETHHADLGYAACQAVILLIAGLVANKHSPKVATVCLIIACLLSTAFARSRAGLVFSILGGAMVLATAALSRSRVNKLSVFVVGCSLLAVGALVISIAAKTDPRWQYMETNMAPGWLGDPVELQCNGTASVEAEIRSMYSDKDIADRAISSVKDGDGSRIVLLRAGTQLALQHPWGLDGSRQAYQKVLRIHCPQTVTYMAHAHDGWVDTALAIGWSGMILYLLVFLNYIYRGYRALHESSEVSEWALVLVALSVFWILRAFTDSVFRDHMFEMQGFILAFAYMSVATHSSSRPPSKQPD